MAEAHGLIFRQLPLASLPHMELFFGILVDLLKMMRACFIFGRNFFVL
jgi:hypothetical protein